MKKRTHAILIAFAVLFTLFLFIEPPENATGFSVTDRISSFFVGNSVSSLGPLTVLSLIFAVGIIGIYEMRKE